MGSGASVPPVLVDDAPAEAAGSAPRAADWYGPPSAYGFSDASYIGWKSVVTDVDGDDCPDVFEASGGDQAPQRLVMWRGACAMQRGELAYPDLPAFREVPSRATLTAQRTTTMALADVDLAQFGPELVFGTWSGSCNTDGGLSASSRGAGSGVLSVPGRMLSMSQPGLPGGSVVTPSWLLPAYMVRAVELGDLDGDGLLDLVVAGARDDAGLKGWCSVGDTTARCVDKPLSDCLAPPAPDRLAWYEQEAADHPVAPPTGAATGGGWQQLGVHRGHPGADTVPFGRAPDASVSVAVSAAEALGSAPPGSVSASLLADVNGDGFLDLLAAFQAMDVWVFFGGRDIGVLEDAMAGASVSEGAWRGQPAPSCTEALASGAPACRVDSEGTIVTALAVLRGDPAGSEAEQGTWLAMARACTTSETGDRCDPAHDNGLRVRRLQDGTDRQLEVSFLPTSLAVVGVCSVSPDSGCPGTGAGLAVAVGGVAMNQPAEHAVQVLPLDPASPPVVVPGTQGRWVQDLTVIDAPQPPRGAPPRPCGSTSGVGRVVSLPGAGPFVVSSVTVGAEAVPACEGAARPCYVLRGDGRTVEVLGASLDTPVRVDWLGAIHQHLLATASFAVAQSFLLPDQRAAVARPTCP